MRRALILAIIVLTLTSMALALYAIRAQRVATNRLDVDDPASGRSPRLIIWTTPQKLGESINSQQDEYEPRVHPDGSLLVFVRGRVGENADLWSSRRTAQGWGEARPVEGINTSSDEIAPAWSPDGDALYFATDRAGGAGGYDLWMSAYEGGEFGSPALVPGEINTDWHEYGAAIAPDRHTLIFASNRPEGAAHAPDRWPATVRALRGGPDHDLYRVTRDHDGSWVRTERLGLLSSRDEDGAPAWSGSGDFLYFTSDRTGDFAIFRSRWTREGFEAPIALPEPVNGARDVMDPAPLTGGYELLISAAAEGEDFDLHLTRSREIELRTEWSIASISGLLPWLLAILALLLIALLAWLLWRLLRGDGPFSLGLAGRSLLISVLIHVLLLLLMTTWTVGGGLLRALREQSGGSVVLSGGAADASLDAQLFGEIVETSTTATHLDASRAARTLTESALASAEAALPERTVPSLLPPIAAAAAMLSLSPSPDVRAPVPDSRQPSELPADTAGASVDLEVPAPERMALSSEASAAPSALEPPSHAARAQANADSAADEPVALTALAAPGVRSPASHASHEAPEVPTTQTRAEAPLADAAAPDLAAASTPLMELAPASLPAPARENAEQPRPDAPAVALSHRAIARDAPDAEARTIPAVGAESTALRSATHTEVPAVAANIEPQSATTGNAPLPAPPLPTPLASPSPTMPADARSAREPAVNTALPISAGSAIVDADPATTTTTELSRLDVAKSEALPAGELSRAENHAPASLPAPEMALAAPHSAARAIEASVAPLPSSEPPEPPPAAVELPALDELALAAPGIAPSPSREHPAESDRVPLEPPAYSLEARQSTLHAKNEAHRAAEAAVPEIDSSPALVAADLPAASLEITRSPDAPTPDAPELALAPALEDELVPMPPALPGAIDPAYAQRQAEIRREIIEERGGSRETEAAVAKALDWLARHQSDDGRWSSMNFDDACGRCGDAARVRADRATTGLSLLCFLAADHVHVRENIYQQTVRRGIDWLLSQQGEDGGFHDQESMYSHGIATLALAEALGMTGDERLRAPVERAVLFIEHARNRERGGWRYAPRQSGDTSVLGWQVMAIKSAQRAGIAPPPESLAGARDWLDLVRDPRQRGVYLYRPGERSTPAMTAEALFVHQLLGSDPVEHDMDASVAFVLRHSPEWSGEGSTYFWYYAMLALFHRQDDAWKTWNNRVQEVLLAHQEQQGADAGSWTPRDNWSVTGGRVYQTAICTLSLQVYYRYLPLYIRDRPTD